MNATDSSSGSVPNDERLSRPVGIWVTAIAAWLVVIATMQNPYRVLHNYDPLQWPPGVLPRSIALIIVLLVICISSVAMLTRRRTARNIFLVGAMVLAVAGAWDGLLIVRFLLSASTQEALGSWSWPQWWAFSTPFRWMAWLAGNYWYLLGRRARGYFSD